ncbi:hypothetical protein TraAM80_03411 [Trypanosoma rangeli]|uniref:Uncharacterized protein n=1 Tax=Trypanosoma rangeli TaxID=5698 RepID=A0A3R7L4H6_TRYRA|nr:uncharacterized protein TraAM80_03411 [Trypanosoma rangeli]RNF07436.1 hypothetical protein TraAM80_03411 [Trypanosoma rangeli]|eukprot:RNF07436.1 hypothetical protein TraAM80_03411 [Trypanosoma rangeli]
MGGGVAACIFGGPPNASSRAASFPPQPDPNVSGRFLLLRPPGNDSTGAAHARRARVLFSHPFLATAVWPFGERAVDHSSERAVRPALGESWATRHWDFLGAWNERGKVRLRWASDCATHAAGWDSGIQKRTEKNK